LHARWMAVDLLEEYLGVMAVDYDAGIHLRTS
jgi:hypothetical protein